MSEHPMPDRAAALALLRWYVEMGADEAIGETAPNRLAEPERPPVAPIAPPVASTPVIPRPPAPATRVAPPGTFAESLAEAAQSARRLAATADSIDALAALVAAFDDCPLKRTATKTVFIDGNRGLQRAVAFAASARNQQQKFAGRLCAPTADG